MQHDICDTGIYTLAYTSVQLLVTNTPGDCIIFHVRFSFFQSMLYSFYLYVHYLKARSLQRNKKKQLLVWQILPNDYIQSISLAPGNAKSNVKMQKKKKKETSSEKSWWSLPYFQGHIKSSSRLVRPSDFLTSFCLDHLLWQDLQE